MKAVILAGGKGTRLGDLAKDIPKSLVPIAGKPLLDYQLEWLAREGVKEVLLLTGYLSEKIEAHCGDGSKWGLKCEYLVEDTPLGTAGALKDAESKLPGEFLVVYGDVLVDIDLKNLMEFHQSKKDSVATLMVHPNDHPHDSDLIEFDGNHKITQFHGKPHDPNRWYHNQVNAAVYVLSPKIFSHLEKGKFADLGRDVFPGLVKQENFYAYPSAEYLKDMGNPERLDAVERDVRSGKVSRLNRKNPRPAVFLDRDGVICPHQDYLHDAKDFRLFPEVPEALKKLNKSDYLTVLVTNQPVVARGLTDEAGVREIHKKMESLLGQEGAKLDAIYFCPHHPDGGFEGERSEYKVNCECRKPGPGMIHQAAEFFNLDLTKSYIVGDTWRDIGAGRSAKLKACLGVKQAQGRVGEYRDQTPDQMFDSLAGAVDYILQQP
ncbi:MAG: HAD-IIIA family hydrolase [Bdellovibrionaceae bacterium]|nr:HAD-IIIA family hydrolase [Pseudobdellovibrionaceae bacterium]